MNEILCSKSMSASQQEESFDPNRLLDALINMMQLKNDAALCRRLRVAPSVISNIRRGQLPVGASMLVRMHEESGVSIKELRALMGDRREKFRMTYELHQRKAA